MKTICLLLLLTFIVCEEQKFAQHLTASTFDQFLEKNKYVLVKFYAPWCGHCKAMAPDYEAVAKTLHNEKSEIKLVKVDCTIEEELMHRFNIEGYPTLKFFINGQPFDYSGGRSQKEILDWVKKRSGPISTEVFTIEVLEKFISDNQLLVLYLGMSPTEEQFTIYQNVALQASTKFDFQHTFYDKNFILSRKLYSKDRGTDPAIILFKQYDEGRVEFDGVFNEETINWFLMNHSNKQIMDFDSDSADQIFGGQNPTLFLVYDGQNVQHKQFEDLQFLNIYFIIIQSVFEAAQNDMKGKIFFCKANFREQLPERLMEFMGIKEEQLPHYLIIGFADHDIQKYMLPAKGTSKEQLISFFEDWKNNKLKPVYKSGEIPESNNGDVLILVQKQFKQLVIENEKDVVVNVYTPWCQKCTEFSQTFEALAKELKQTQPQVVFGSLNAAENEVQELIIKGLPSLQIFKSNDKGQPVEFDYKDMSIDSVRKFIQENVSSWHEKSGEESKTDL